MTTPIQRERTRIADLVWAYIRDQCPPITPKGETTISVDALLAIIEGTHE
jgi:hypothetical protein